MLREGLYESVINDAIQQELDKLVTNYKTEKTQLDSQESANLLARYLAPIIEGVLKQVPTPESDLSRQIVIVNQIVALLASAVNDEAVQNSLVKCPGEQLLALIKKENSIYSIAPEAAITRPQTSIAQSTLFTGAQYEPQMYFELKKEIALCDTIDMLVSFIKWSGLRLIIDALKEFTNKGGKLRIITTSYMGATDPKAIEELASLENTEIKVSYDTKRTRLHAKAYIFNRKTGFSTAYIGSSNLSNAAISSGLEWNIKIAKKDMPETMEKIEATFDNYWYSSEFEPYSPETANKLKEAIKNERASTGNASIPFVLDIQPYQFQQKILDELLAERNVHGSFRNLIVAATGTGKTVISAFDYKRFRQEHKGKTRLLFIAHREEILKQSISVFRSVLKDANFGDLFVGNHTPSSIDHLFMSIQTFNSQNFAGKTSSNFYDYIVVDEFHHAAAPSYAKLLTYYEPKILLGLTATPERLDGKSVLSYFDERIAAEIRLPEAIDRKLLCPFQYFGVTDTVDLRDITWVRGGYDRNELSNLFSINQVAAESRAECVLQAIFKYVTDIDSVKGLAFCVSKEHARFMSDFFNRYDVPSIWLTSDSATEERNDAKRKLQNGEIRFICVVDLYNEGVDIPEINTVLFLRPTESLTIFLQQLGRGLRLTPEKDCLTVLDFIAQSNKKYNFENKFLALLEKTTKAVKDEIKSGFTSLPKGCYIQLERIAQQHILENIQNSFTLRIGLISKIQSFAEESGLPLSLQNFVSFYKLDMRNIYTRGTFARLCVAAGAREPFEEPFEEDAEKAFFKLCSIDSRRWLKFMLHVLETLHEGLRPQYQEGVEARMFRMFYYTLFGQVAEPTKILEKLEIFKAENPVLFAEMIALLQYNYSAIDFLDEQVDQGFDSPLDLHCQYTRDQVLLAMDYMKPANIREGVKWLSEKNIDLLFVTLNKSDKDYSPTTLYEDYSVSEDLFHWQSQSTTPENSPTGQRYIHHKENGSKVLLFVREYKSELGKAAPYSFLGAANYVSHQGSRPMSILWRLERPIPAKYLKKTNKLLVG